MPTSIRAGDVVAGRYRVVDLLSENRGGRFWRAEDTVLSRHVALHLIPADDPRGETLLEVARASARVSDRRLLRVLDAERLDDVCFVVNEWGEGTSLDNRLGTEGPLSPREAAWITAEVGEVLAGAHEAGLSHGRLNPENVLIDQHGGVRVIGFGVDAALHGLPHGRRSADVADLAGVLYAALTGKWAGVSHSVVPSAPTENGHVLRARQVRAGIPRALDSLCDEVLNHDGSREAGRGPHDLGTARGITDALLEHLGDTTGFTLGAVAADATQVHEAVPSQPGPSQPPEATQVTPVDVPTQAGLPVFEDGSDDVTWLERRADPPPPPDFEEPPERPLFAPDPPEGPRPRRPQPTPGTGSGYWPWESESGAPLTGTGQRRAAGGPPPEEVPGRNWLRLGIGLGIGLLVLVAAVTAFQFGLGNGGEPLSGEEPTTGESSQAPTVATLSGLTVTDLDPQGDPTDENPELTPLTVDGDPATAWRTLTYDQNFGPAGLKTGVGLVVDLGGEQEVSDVTVRVLGGTTTMELYVADQEPTDVTGLDAVATGSTSGEDGRVRLSPEEPVTGTHAVLWLTSLPAVDGGFRGQVAEVVVRARE